MSDIIAELPRLEMDTEGKYSLAYNPERNCLPVAWYRYGEYWTPWDGNNPALAMFYALLASREKVKELEAKR